MLLLHVSSVEVCKVLMPFQALSDIILSSIIYVEFGVSYIPK